MVFQSDLTFYKYQALGNDYIVIDPKTYSVPLTPQAITTICHRNYGIGSDGILFGPHFSENSTISLNIYNPDGSEAEKSGNGLRIFAKYLKDNGYVLENTTSIDTKGGRVHVTYLNNDGTQIQIDMGAPIFETTKIPVNTETPLVLDTPLTILDTTFHINCVSMGNPHCVIFLDDIDQETALKYGPLIETHSLFPNRTNVQFVKVIDRDTIQIEIWERGAGYTLASGSSSCAAASAAIKRGYVDDTVTVLMPGGTITIKKNKEGSILMTGPVESIGYGILNPAMITESPPLNVDN